MTKAAGNIVLSGSTFGVDMTSGEVKVPAGTVKVDAGAFAIPNVAKRPSDGIVEFQLSGPVAAIAQIADADPINALAERDMSPADLSAAPPRPRCRCASRCATRSTRPMSTGRWWPRPRRPSSKAPIDGRILTDADVTLTITPDDVTVYGKAKIDGVRGRCQHVAADHRRRRRAAAGRAPGAPRARRCGAQAPRRRARRRAVRHRDGAGHRRRCRQRSTTSSTSGAPASCCRASAGRRASACRRRCPSTWSRPATASRSRTSCSRATASVCRARPQLDSASNLISADIDNLSLHAGEFDLAQADAQQCRLRHIGARRRLRHARAAHPDPRSQRGGRRLPRHRRRRSCRQADRLQPGGRHRGGADPGLGGRRDAEAFLHRQHRRFGSGDRLFGRRQRDAAQRQRRRCRSPAALRRPLHPCRRRHADANRPGRAERPDGRHHAGRRLQRAERAGHGAGRRRPQRRGRRPRRVRSGARAFRSHGRPLLARRSAPS